MSSTFNVSVDARFELLGVLHQLAGRGRPAPGAEAYRDEVERRFAAFRRHEAVERFKELVSRDSRREALGTLLINYSEPPALALKDESVHLHYRSRTGEPEELELFLEALRAFAKASGFMEFFRSTAAFRREVEARALKLFGARDPVVELERYLGMPLASRAHYILPLLYENDHNFIVPYPLPSTAKGAKSFDVYTVSSLTPADFGVWNELVHVFVDPAFHRFDALYAPEPAGFYGAEVARGRLASPDRAKNAVAQAIVNRLLLATRTGVEFDLSEPFLKDLSDRLAEYEADRVRWPTLWDFFPRLLSVYREKAFPGAKPLAVRTDMKIRSVVDFF